jgi:hypothetical protein
MDVISTLYSWRLLIYRESSVGGLQSAEVWLAAHAILYPGRLPPGTLVLLRRRNYCVEEGTEPCMNLPESLTLSRACDIWPLYKKVVLAIYRSFK